MKKGFIKRTAVILGALIGLLFITLAVIPLVVDVDRYRPQLIELANQNLNGKLEIQKLSLSLWGRIRVQVMGLAVVDTSGARVLGVDDAYFELPVLSILRGTPTVVFKMEKPVVSVVKNKAGQFNLTGLMKSSAPKKSSNVGIALPAIVVSSSLTIELSQALLSYIDDFSGLKTEIQDLNIAFRDVSLVRSSQIELSATLNNQFGKSVDVRGPFRMIGQLNPVLTGTHLDHVSLKAQLDLDPVEIRMGNLFEKKGGVPAHAQLSMQASEKEFLIEDLKAQLLNIEIQAHGKVSSASSVIEFSAQSNSINLQPWVEWVPMLNQYRLGGAASFQANVKGPVNRLGYTALFKMVGVTAQAPRLKTQPVFDAEIKVITDQIENFLFTMKAPGNDLRIEGKLKDFLKPKAIFKVTSTGMDLDQLIDFPSTTDALKTGSPASPGVSASAEKQMPVVDRDALLAPLRANRVAQATDATVSIQIPFLKAYHVKMTDLAGKVLLHQLEATLDHLGMKVWDGSIQAQALLQLKDEKPFYQFRVQTAQIDLKNAVQTSLPFFSSIFQSFKDTILGKASVDLNGMGRSFNSQMAMDQLSMKGNFKVDDATFSSIDLGKVSVYALNQTIGKVAEKIPSLQGKKVNPIPVVQTSYQSISSDFSIAANQFKAPNFFAKAAPNQGFDLKGSVIIGMKDRSLNALWEFSDPYNLTHAREIGVEVDGTRIDHVFAEGNHPIRFLVHLDCALTAPCASYQEVPEYLGKIALANLAAGIKNKARGELKKKVEPLVEKALKTVPVQVPKKLEDLGKKLFGG